MKHAWALSAGSKPSQETDNTPTETRHSTGLQRPYDYSRLVLSNAIVLLMMPQFPYSNSLNATSMSRLHPKYLRLRFFTKQVFIGLSAGPNY